MRMTPGTSGPRDAGLGTSGRRDGGAGTRDGLASHAVARAVLSGAGAGHDPVRDGTGWSGAARGHASPHARAVDHWSRGSGFGFGIRTHVRGERSAARPYRRPGGVRRRTSRGWGTSPPSTMSTARLRSVARRPPAASQPGGLPGVLPVASEKAHLGAGFPLRCCQRLSLPHVATQRCRLSDNWHTSGASSPVLSY